MQAIVVTDHQWLFAVRMGSFSNDSVTIISHDNMLFGSAQKMYYELEAYRDHFPHPTHYHVTET